MMTCLCSLYLISIAAAVSNYRETAELTIALSEYYNAECINFLTESQPEKNLFIGKVLRDVATPSGRLSNAHSFDTYFFEKEMKKLRCDLPLQVVVSYDEATRIAFMQHSHRSSMHGSDSPGGGIWLVFLKSVKEEFLQDYFKGINTPFDVQLIIAEQQHNEMALKEVYRVRHDKPLRSNNLGKWSRENGLQLMVKYSSVHYSRRSDLEGISVNVGYVLSDPYTQEYEQNGRITLGGYLGDVWEILESELNVSTKFTHEPNYGTYSYSKKEWSGLVRHVSNSDYDVGIADLTLTKKRNEAVSYSNPLVVTTFNVFYQSSGSSIETGALFLPLATDLWLSLVGWIIVAAVILYFGCYLSDKELHTYENMTLMNALFFVAGALCGQGGVHMPQTSTCRVFFISTFVITGIIIPAYSASLMSILTISKPVVPYSNMKEFFENGKSKMMVMYSSYEYELFSFETTNDPYMNKIFKRDIEPLPSNEFPTSTQNAIQKVCKNEGHAFFGLSDALRWAINKEEKREGRNRKCTVLEMSINFGKISLGIAFPKNSHIRGIINHHLSYLPVTGILARLKRKHWPPNQPLIGLDEHQPVQLANVLMMFAVMGFGIIASVLFLLIEIILGRRRKVPKKLEKEHSWPVRRRGVWDSVMINHYRK